MLKNGSGKQMQGHGCARRGGPCGATTLGAWGQSPFGWIGWGRIVWTCRGAIGVDVVRTKVSGVDVLGGVSAREVMEEVEVYGRAQCSSSSSFS